MNNKLNKTAANYQNLSPISFLLKAARIFPESISVIYKNTTFTWAETLQRCSLFASALQNAGLKKGDVVKAWMNNYEGKIVSKFHALCL